MPSISRGHHLYVQQRSNTYWTAISFQQHVTPQLRTKFEERAFSHAGPAAWNSLPPDIRAT